MRWPWQRHETEAAAGGQEATPPVSELVSRPRGQWRGLQPLSTVTGAVTGPAASAAEPLEFVRTLSTRWQVPPALEPLGHEVALTAPAGQVPVAGVPVQGYPEPPELVWAAVPDVVPGESGPLLAHPAPVRHEGADGLRAAVGTSPGPVLPVVGPVPSVAPVGAPVGAPVVAPGPEVGAVRGVVGTSEPLVRAAGRGTPDVPPSAGPVVAPDAEVRAALTSPVRQLSHLRPEPAASEAVPGRPGVDLLPPPVVAPVRAADVASSAPEPSTVPWPSVPQGPLSHPASERAAEHPVATSVASGRPETTSAPSQLPRRVHGLAGETSALVTARAPLHAAAADPVAAARPAEEVESAPSRVEAGRSAPGLGVPDWFSSGAVRSVPPATVPPGLPRPTAVETPRPMVGRRALITPAEADTAVRSRSHDDPAPGRVSSRRVPWPQPEDPAAADDDGGTDEVEPVDVPEEADEARGPEPDVAREQTVAVRPDQHPDPGPATVAARAWENEPSAELSARADPLPEAVAATRRFRVGTPLPRPAAAARWVAAPGGLADLATAAMAAASQPDAEGPIRDGRPRVSESVQEQPVRRSPAGLVPADLGLPTDTGPSAAPGPSATQETDDHDDLDQPVGASVEELYEQVRTRLRHELLIDRERAAMLAD